MAYLVQAKIKESQCHLRQTYSEFSEQHFFKEDTWTRQWWTAAPTSWEEKYLCHILQTRTCALFEIKSARPELPNNQVHHWKYSILEFAIWCSNYDVNVQIINSYYSEHLTEPLRLACCGHGALWAACAMYTMTIHRYFTLGWKAGSMNDKSWHRPQCDVVAKVHSLKKVDDIGFFQQLLISFDVCREWSSRILSKFIQEGCLEVCSYLQTCSWKLDRANLAAMCCTELMESQECFLTKIPRGSTFHSRFNISPTEPSVDFKRIPKLR